MKEVFEISAAIISSIGGASVIIIAVSSWLGKIWANKIFESEKEKHIKDIENYKNELLIELERLRTLNEKKIFVSKLQFEKEFQIYIELCESLFDIYVFTNELFPRLDSAPEDTIERKECYSKRYKDFCEKYNIYLKTIDKYAPFYSKAMFSKFHLIRELCREQGVNFEIYRLGCGEVEQSYMDSSINKKIYREIPEELKLRVDSLQDEIRNYLITLRSI